MSFSHPRGCGDISKSTGSCPGFPLESRGDDASQFPHSVKEEVERKNRWFAEAFGAGMGTFELCRMHSDAIDRIISSLIGGCGDFDRLRDRFVIVALGGYGRREMGLFCDIDLLFLHDHVGEGEMRKVAESVLYPMWDAGAEIGGATRTIEDCRAVMGNDVKAFTAMIDARPIIGNSDLFAKLIAMVKTHFRDRGALSEFVDEKFEERRQRLKKFGDSIYLLEPNIKEGEGGLRDYHTLVWMAQAMEHSAPIGDPICSLIPSDKLRGEIDESVGFLWRIRHALHIIEGGRSDRLTAPLQGDVARKLDIAGTDALSAAERLMSTYYGHAGRIHLQCMRSLERMRRTLRPVGAIKRFLSRRLIRDGIYRTEYGTLAIDATSFEMDPIIALRAFGIGKRLSLPLDPESKDAIAHGGEIDEGMRCSDDARRTWMDILSGFKNLDRVLHEMHECNHLVRWFPEMSPMINLIKHDGFHMYTVGLHSIRAVGEISALLGKQCSRDNSVPAGALKIVARPHILALASLFHDIGKGGGGEHPERGSLIAANIGRRLGIAEADIADLSFLVRSHLLMSTVAFKRDVHDPALIDRFARSLGSPEMLAMLYLLTFADIRSIGPNVWNRWKGCLLAELYEKTLASLTGGSATALSRRGEASRRLEVIRRHLGESCSADDIRAYLSGLPERYLFSNSEGTIAAHILMTKDIESSPVATTFRVIADRGCSEISVVTRDKPGLFAEISGILTAGGANIVDAELYTSRDGIAVDIFLVTDSTGRPLADPDVWERIRNEMNLVISGREDLERLVEGRFRRRFLGWSQRYRPARIVIDNDVSAFETVVEIQADDRRGLLYTIASTLHELGLVVDKARIQTHVDRVIDVFYIRDSEGAKIISADSLKRIEEGLLQALEE